MKVLQAYDTEIALLCKTHKVKSLYAFGSILTETFRDESDVDLIVSFSNIPVEDYADNYFEFKFALQSLLNRKVDLLEEKALKNPYVKDLVDEKKQLVYGN